jgi:hypothetical protein
LPQAIRLRQGGGDSRGGNFGGGALRGKILAAPYFNFEIHDGRRGEEDHRRRVQEKFFSKIGTDSSRQPSVLIFCNKETSKTTMLSMYPK